MAFNKDFSTYFLTQPEEEDFQVSYSGNEDGFTCSHCNTSYEKDLQLAAELGKTLLERNKELETSLKQHQNVLEDQAQEIEYLTKQTTALREVNDSRLRIYEQLEVSIQELERNNQRLLFDHSNDKKTIKTQVATIESLENRCDELQLSVNELSVELEKAKRCRRTSSSGGGETRHPSPRSSLARQDEEVSGLLTELQEMKAQRTRDLRKITDLEDNIANLVQENSGLEQRVAAVSEREQDLKTMQQELSTLEDIRQGHLCRRCLRIADDNRSCLGDDDEETASLIESLMSEADQRYILAQLQESLASTDTDNPYRILVQKYEELVRAQRKIQCQGGEGVGSGGGQPLSLQEELEMSGLGNTRISTSSGPNSGFHDSGPMSLQEELDLNQHGGSTNQKTPVSQKTSRDFCESDTSSSGFSDDISNKSTQTELKALLPSGAFLCTISDGADARFSIYDAAGSPVESRFRQTPEYRQLFREIFDVLKRAAEAKEEGERLPLLDDTLTSLPLPPVPPGEGETRGPEVPPGTPAKEDLPLLRLIEDTQSVISEEASELASNADSSLDYMSLERELRQQTADSSLDYISIENDLLRRDAMDQHGGGDSQSEYAQSTDGRASVLSCESGEVDAATLKRSKKSRRRRNTRRREAEQGMAENNPPSALTSGERADSCSRDASEPRGHPLVRRSASESGSHSARLGPHGESPLVKPTPVLGTAEPTSKETPPTISEPPKQRRDIFEDLIEGVKSRKKSKRQARLLEERRDTPSPPALVGINNMFVSNKLIRRARRQNCPVVPARAGYVTRYDTSAAAGYDAESPYAVSSSSAAQEVAKLKILEKSYAEVLKNNSRHHHQSKQRASFNKKYN